LIHDNMINIAPLYEWPSLLL